MELFPHQIKALEQTKDLNRVAYYLDMGLGKTFVGSEKMVQLGSNINLLVCQKSKFDDWINHFKEYYEDMVIYDLTTKELDCFCNKQNNDLQCNRKIVGIINYELLWRRPQLIKSLSDFTLMLDESSLIQNPTAKQTKAILKLKPTSVILLSGTPTSGKYENLWTQAHLLGWGIKKDVYNSQYINWRTIDVEGLPIKIVDKVNPYKNVDRLKRKFREHGAVFMKTEECFELPNQTFIKQYIPISKEYKEFKKNLIVTVGDTELRGDTILTQRLYLRQLCGAYSKEKLNAFRDLAQSTNDRLIVFYNFKNEATELLNIAKDLSRPVSIVSGDVKILDAYEQYDDSITLIQYQAGAMGLNLQKANKIVYFTLPERSDLFEQSKKRIHRIGQTQSCFYYILMCKGSIEEDIYKALEQKRDYTDDLFIN